MDIVFASNNKNKIAEIQHMLPSNIQILSLQDIGCDVDIPETADSIEGNAVLKANYVTEHYRYDCFADDTGLEVTALNGAPGVYSARYAGAHKSPDDNMDKLLDELQDKPDRSAQFKTVIALNLKGRQHLFTGIVKGEIARDKTGDHGFGYDPVFKSEGHDRTFAQLSMQEKAALGHRGKAVRQLIDFLTKTY